MCLVARWFRFLSIGCALGLGVFGLALFVSRAFAVLGLGLPCGLVLRWVARRWAGPLLSTVVEDALSTPSLIAREDNGSLAMPSVRFRLLLLVWLLCPSMQAMLGHSSGMSAEGEYHSGALHSLKHSDELTGLNETVDKQELEPLGVPRGVSNHYLSPER